MVFSSLQVIRWRISYNFLFRAPDCLLMECSAILADFTSLPFKNAYLKHTEGVVLGL